MTQSTEFLFLIVAAAVGIISTLIMLRRQRRDRDALTQESPFATSTEGMKRCPNCGMFNQWTDRTCISCGRSLRG